MTAAAQPPPVAGFQGPYRFLSNFHPAPIRKWGRTWPTAEHVYQASKRRCPDYRDAIFRARTPGKAKRLGSRVLPTEDWERRRLRVMKDVVMRKFTQNPPLEEALLATGDAVLVEGNRWGDRFWGVCDGVGDNRLGRILMRVRDRLRRARDAAQTAALAAAAPLSARQTRRGFSERPVGRAPRPRPLRRTAPSR